MWNVVKCPRMRCVEISHNNYGRWLYDEYLEEYLSNSGLQPIGFVPPVCLILLGPNPGLNRRLDK